MRRSRKPSAALVLVAVIGCSFAHASIAASGDTVSSYGQNGTVTLPSITYGSEQDVVVSLQTLQNGTSYVLRIPVDSNSKESYVVYRLTAAGAVDSSFAANGVRITNTTGSYLRYQGLLVDESKPRFYLIGRDNNGPTIDAFKFDGSADSGFGSGGHVSLETIPDADAAAEYASFDSAGRILVAMHFSNSEQSTPNNIELARLSAAGVMDTSFGAAGISRVQFADSTHYGDPIAPLELGPGGSIIVAYQEYGSCSSAESNCNGYSGAGVAMFPAQGFATTQMESNSNTVSLMSGNAEPLATVLASPGVYAALIADYDNSTFNTTKVTTNGNAMPAIVAAPEAFPSFRFISDQNIGIFSDGTILIGGYGPQQNPSTVQVAKLAGNGQLIPYVAPASAQVPLTNAGGGGSFEWLSLAMLTASSWFGARRRRKRG